MIDKDIMQGIIFDCGNKMFGMKANVEYVEIVENIQAIGIHNI